MPIQVPFPIPSKGFALNSKLRVNLDFIIGKFNEFNSGTATWDTVAVGTANNLTGTVTFYNSSNSNYFTVQAGATNSNTTLTLPANAIPGPTLNLLSFTSAGVGSWIAGLANFADAAATFVTMSAETNLPNERRVNAGTGISIADGGAGSTVTFTNTGVINITGTANQVIASNPDGNVTLSLPQDIGTTSTPTFGRITLGAGDITNPAVAIGDSNTGFYEAAGDGNINLALDGTIAVQWTKADLMLWNSGPIKTSSLVLRDGAGSNPTVTINPPTSFTSYTLTMPTSDGDSNQVLTTNGSGVLSWQDAATVAGSANTALSNLASVAINTTLVSDTDNTDDLGTSSIAWKDLYLDGDVKVGSTTAIDLAASGAVSIRGSATNDAAAAGFVGETVVATASQTDVTSTGTWSDAASISLTAGTWLLFGQLGFDKNDATWTGYEMGISTTSGNSASGLTDGSTRARNAFASSSTTPDRGAEHITPLVVPLSGTTTYYLKVLINFSAGTPRYSGGRIQAIRIR